MRAACVIAMVASLFVFTGCCGIGGSPCGGGGCDGYQGGSPAQFFGGGGGGCDSGCDSGYGYDSGGGTSASFSDIDCGPMCGAYLQSGQVSSGCSDCQMGKSYLQGQVNSLRAALPARPFAGVFSGPCRGLGAAVGCIGCGECAGGSAIGLNHSDTSGPMGAGGGCGACGQAGCGGGCGAGGGRLKSLLGFGSGKSIHPYGGEIPHTASAAGAAGGGAPGGAAPTYAYPYYTTRGPRDFLMSNPPSIGR